MLEVMFVTVVLIGGLWAAVCIIDHTHKLRMREIEKFIRRYEEVHMAAERRRSATEMAATIRLVERFIKEDKRS